MLLCRRLDGQQKRSATHDHDLSGINFCLKGRNKLNILRTFFKTFVKPLAQFVTARLFTIFQSLINFFISCNIFIYLQQSSTLFTTLFIRSLFRTFLEFFLYDIFFIKTKIIFLILLKNVSARLLHNYIKCLLI